MAAPRNAAIGALRLAGFTNIAAPIGITPATAAGHWPSSASPNDSAGPWVRHALGASDGCWTNQRNRKSRTKSRAPRSGGAADIDERRDVVASIFSRTRRNAQIGRFNVPRNLSAIPENACRLWNAQAMVRTPKSVDVWLNLKITEIEGAWESNDIERKAI